MTKLHRNQFTQANIGRNLDLEKLQNNEEAQAQLSENGVSMSRLRRADRNADGKLTAREAWSAADYFDRDGSAGSLIAKETGPNGQATPTQAGKTATVLGMMLQRDDLQAEPGKNDDVLLLGMGTETLYSAGAKHEIKELRKTGTNVVGITDARTGNDTIRVDGRTYDLTTEDGRTGFVGTLGLPEEQSGKISEVLGNAGADAKDEMAQLAQVWSEAEKGGEIPSRMIISGHHVGSAVWGDGNGRIPWDQMKNLADAMPKAASQVEDLHLSACYSGGSSKRQMFQEIFPNVKTVWAYSGSAPGTGSGATIHQAAWERATRGDGTDIAGTAERLQSRGIRKADNIDTGIIGQEGSGMHRPIGELRDEFRSQEGVYESFFSGNQNVENSQRGPLREYYNDIQNFLEHPGLTDTERTEVEDRRDQTIRTLFYDSHIRHRFNEAHSGAIQEGYQAMGMETPDFEHLSRQDAMESIRQFRDQVEGNSEAPEAAQNLLPLLNGFWNLSSDVIPETWI